MRIFYILMFTLVVIFNSIALSSQGNSLRKKKDYERIPVLPELDPLEAAFSSRPYQPFLGKDGYPVLLGDNILVRMKNGIYFRGLMHRTPMEPYVPFWMKPESQLVSRPYHGTYVYIRTETQHLNALHGIEPIPPYETFDERTLSPHQSWINLGNEDFFAINFEPYEVNSPHTEFGPNGRIYVGNKYGYIFSSSLQPKPGKKPRYKKKRGKQSVLSQ